MPDKKEIEKMIIDFLDGGGYLALGTCKDNIPRVTPVSFESEGMTIWIVADPGGKVENMKANPNVAAAIYSRIEEGVENISLQIQGKAQLITYENNRDEFMERAKKRGMIERLEQRKNKETGLIYSPFLKKEVPMEDILKRITFVKIEPDEVTYLSLGGPEGGKRFKWKKNE
ncbi:MAG: hypothetical protein D6734_03565 [Candidatus Schekmanbacteria bacterium]|nr:MAG: hypothetical protein D6734_03565 [Candidatus Schekmanbacteria bacterium]